MAKIKAVLDTSEIMQQIRTLEQKIKMKINVDTGNSKKGIDNVNKSINTAQKRANSFGDTLKRSLNIGSVAAITAKGIQLIHKAFREATTAVKEFDAAITDVRTVTGASYVEAAKMVREYNQIGKELGATTKEVTDSAVTWLRQGKSPQETSKLIYETTKLAKIGFIDEANAANYLTSTLNGYRLAVDDAANVVDKLAKLDSAAAVTAGGLAEGMSRTAVTADNVGISMDKLLGILTAIGNVNPNLDMTVIGNSVKTILTRMNNIKAGKLELIDEDGTVEILSDVETVLNNAGIKLRDSQNEFRNFGDVLDETGAAWDTYSSVQQAAIAKAFAGTRQQENFRVLMNNYQSAIDFANLAANSAGTAEQKFAAYLDSIEAKTKSLQAAFESLAVNNLSTELFGGIIDATTALVEFFDKTNLLKGTLAGLAAAGAIKVFTVLATGIFNAAIKLNEFNAALKLVKAGNIGEAEIEQLARMTANLSQSQLKAVLSSKALSTEQRIAILTSQGLSTAEAKAALSALGLSTAEGAATASTFSLRGALQGLWTTLMANPLILVVAAITAVVSVVSTMKQKAEEARQSAIDSAQSAMSLSSELSELVMKYNELSEAVKTDESVTDSFISTQDELIEKLGLTKSEIQGLIDEYGNLSDAIKAASVEKLQELERDIRGGLNEYENDLLKAGKADWGIDSKNISGSKTNGFFSTSSETRAEQKRAYEALKALEDAGLISSGSYSSYTDDDGSIYSQGFSTFIGLNADEDLSTVEGIINAYERLGKMLDIVSETAGSDNFVYETLYETYNGLTESINNYEDAIGSLNNNLAEQYTLQGLVGKAIPTTKEEFEKYRQGVIDSAMASGEFVGSQEDVEAAIDKVLGSQIQFADFYDNYSDAVTGAEESTLTAFENIQKRVKEVSETFDTLTNGISAVQDMLSSQATGKSISIADFNSDELADYRSALEYTNGTMQLNADKVNEIVKAKADEQIALNNTDKAMAQSKYLENARQIEQYREQLRDASLTNADARNQIQNNIDSLLEENSAIADTCAQYDLLSASLQEATGAYQHWLNAQSSSDYGDMAQDAVSAIQRIRDTYDSESDIFGDYGSKKFDAAVEFIVPDSVSPDDLSAIESYMDDFKKYLTFDDDGNTTGLNIDKFLADSVEAGLMSYSEDDGFKVLGGKKMEDFAEGLNISSPVVQAFFDELQLKGGEFDWGDEAVKTIGDLAIEANEAAEALRNVDGNSSLKIKMDVSDLSTTKEQCKALNDTIAEMDKVKAKPDVDTTEIDNANAVIQYCLMQKQLLTQPDVMRVDTSKVEGDIGNALALLQEFQNAQNNLEIKQKIGADTSEAQTEVDALTTQIQSISPDIKAKLSLDTTSTDSIKTSIAGLSAETINVKANVDVSAIPGYSPESKTCDVIYNPKTDALPQSFDSINRTVNYLADTSGLPRSFSTITRYVNYVKTGDVSVNGTAHASGTAKVGGDWGTAPGGRTLVGELGQEIVVDPRTGKWYTVGDNGAEFRDIPAGAIVFNHIQSKSLLENGYVAGRASALVGGTAMVTGGYKPYKPNSGGGSSSSGGGSSSSSSSKSSSSSGNSSSSSSSTKEDEPKKVDWIEIAIERIERAINKLKKTAESAYKSLKTRSAAASEEISKVNEELSLQQKAYERYIQEANSVGLSSDLAAKVRDGTIDINEYDSDTQELISDYQEWYEKALDCSDAIDDLHESLASLYEDNFKNIQDDFDNQLSLLEHLSNTYETGMDKLEAQGRLGSTEYYTAMNDAEKKNLATLNNELSSLTQSFSDAMASGEIEEYSEAWYAMQQSINDTKEAIDESTLSILENEKAMRELEWSYFDYIQDRISQITQESNFLIDLISNSKLYEDNGQFNDNGMATLGLRAQNYNVYMAQADQYANEILKLDEEIAKDPYNTDLIERREELLGLQQDSILAAEDEKQAIVDLVREGIEIELDALQDLIDKYTDTIDTAKDLYDYQKGIEEQSKEIATIQKQIAAYSGDNSEETKTTIQKLQVDLSDAIDELEETQYEKYISEQKQMLDNLYLDYETILNARLDNVDALISEMIDTVNANSTVISDTLISTSDKVGYTISEAMSSIWSNEGSASAIVAKYGDSFTGQLTTVNQVLSSISTNVAKMVAESDQEAQETVKPTTPTTTPSAPSTPSNPPSPSTPSKPTPTTFNEDVKRGVAAAIWIYGGSKSGWGNNPDRKKRLTAKFGASNAEAVQSYINAHGSNGDLYEYWARNKKNNLSKYYYSAFKTGGLADYTGFAWMDGTPNKPELVLNAEDTENLIELRDVLRNMAQNTLSLNNPNYSGFDFSKLSGLTDISGILARISVRNGNAGGSIGEINITIPIDHVENYDDFVNQLRKDKKFEQLIQSMTVDRLTGGSSLAKNKYKW